ncbi:hypothetical protein ACOSQ4_001376 [Xanthoceras sorbifolium]
MFSFDGIMKPNIVEPKTILFGVYMALKCGFSSFSIDSDAALIINCLNTGLLFFSEIDVILEDIFLLLESFETVFSFSHVSHSTNKVAHVLAKFSFDCNN